MKPFSNFKKTLAVILVVFFAVPMAFFSQPKKADAFADCVIGALGVAGAVGSVISSVLAVPVSNINIETTSGVTAGQQTAATLKDCVLDSIVNVMVNTLIQQMTDSVINWINSDFEGSPSFISDTEGFFADYADITAGKMIENLGPIGQILCSPFDLQIRLSLGLGFSSSYYREVGCRLSDVQKNVYNAFVGGKWGADGWSNWISVSHPSNNAYGVYIRANDAISREIMRKAGLKEAELSWGRGFLGQTQCKKKDENGRCIDPGYTKTPGAVIESQLNHALGSGTRRIEVADEINEVLNALVAYGMRQIMGGSGLLTGGYTRRGGSSYLSGVMKTYDDQLAATKAVPPAGIKCDYGGRNYWVEQGTKGVLPGNGVPISDIVVKVWKSDWYVNPNPISPVIVNSCVAPTTPLASWMIEDRKGCFAPDTAVASANIDGIPGVVKNTNADDYRRQIENGCFNRQMNITAQNEYGNLPGFALPGADPLSIPGDTSIKNISIGKLVRAPNGSAHDGYLNIASITNGLMSIRSMPGNPRIRELYFAKRGTGVEPTFVIELGKNYEIHRVNLYARDDENEHQLENGTDVKIFEDATLKGAKLNLNAIPEGNFEKSKSNSSNIDASADFSSEQPIGNSVEVSCKVYNSSEITNACGLLEIEVLGRELTSASGPTQGVAINPAQAGNSGVILYSDASLKTRLALSSTLSTINLPDMTAKFTLTSLENPAVPIANDIVKVEIHTATDPSYVNKTPRGTTDANQGTFALAGLQKEIYIEFELKYPNLVFNESQAGTYRLTTTFSKTTAPAETVATHSFTFTLNR